MTPHVTFLMAVYNGAATVQAAIESVLAQTFSDFEFLIINDASTDATAAVISAFRDPRLRLNTNEKNAGLSASLNRGLARARGAFIARMDADDLCLPHRAATQVAFLNAHPEIAAVGSFIETFSNTSPARELIKYPTDPAAIAATLLFRNALAHPAVMLRKSALDQHALTFPEGYWGAQDYALWLTCVEQNLPLANLPEVLLHYRLHQNQLSHSMTRLQSEGTQIRSAFLHNWLGPDVTPEELTLHDALAQNNFTPTAAFISAAAAWLTKLATLNQTFPRFDPTALLRILTGRFVALHRFASSHNLTPPDITQTPFAPYLNSNALLNYSPHPRML